jgi:hypothetical protein
MVLGCRFKKNSFVCVCVCVCVCESAGIWESFYILYKSDDFNENGADFIVIPSFHLRRYLRTGFLPRGSEPNVVFFDMCHESVTSHFS